MSANPVYSMYIHVWFVNLHLVYFDGKYVVGKYSSQSHGASGYLVLLPLRIL